MLYGNHFTYFMGQSGFFRKYLHSPMELSAPKISFVKITTISKCEELKVPKPHLLNMSAKQTPSKTPAPDTTYVECSWTFSMSGSLYVRLSPTLAEALDLKRQVHFRRLGKVDRVSFTKKLKTDQAKHANVFKFDVDTSQHGESQCVDGTDNIIYALKEDKFSDFAVDTMATKLFSGNWRPHKPLLDAHKDAQKKKKLSSQGNWLKEVFKTDVMDTQDPDAGSPAASLLTTTEVTAAPEAFTFNTNPQTTGVPDPTPRPSKQTQEDSDDEDDGGAHDNQQAPASSEMGLGSQRVVQSTHFDFLVSLLFYCWFHNVFFVCTEAAAKRKPNKEMGKASGAKKQKKKTATPPQQASSGRNSCFNIAPYNHASTNCKH